MNTPHKAPLPLVFLALASLTLAGCASSEAGQTTPSEASASTSASAEAITDSSASAPGATSADSSAGEQKYSGGSKAPAGEYRAADEHGPAQNVPKPKEPEGMHVESTEAMEKFIYYWASSRNFAVQTGDITFVGKQVSSDYKEEADTYANWKALYASGGWAVGGEIEPRPYMDGVISHGDGYYSVPINYLMNDVAYFSEGKVTTYHLADEGKRGFELKIQFADDGNWYVIDQLVVGQ
ncbi:DUF6318 family protein [Rothia aerolata]|nr:DUF6318 family protein [Rothia aerolata]